MKRPFWLAMWLPEVNDACGLFVYTESPRLVRCPFIDVTYTGITMWLPVPDVRLEGD